MCSTDRNDAAFPGAVDLCAGCISRAGLHLADTGQAGITRKMDLGQTGHSWANPQPFRETPVVGQGGNGSGTD